MKLTQDELNLLNKTLSDNPELARCMLEMTDIVRNDRNPSSATAES